MKPRFSVDNFGREISCALLVKLVLIYCLWTAFFNAPIDKELTPEGVGQHFLSESTDYRFQPNAQQREQQ